MRLLPARLRIVAGLLMVTQLQACVPAWKPTDRVAPADVVAAWRPAEVRLQLANEQWVVVTSPTVVNDSIVGWVRVRDRSAGHDVAVIAIAMADVRRLRVREIPDVAQRQDIGNGGVVIAPGERVRVTRAAPPGEERESVRGWLERVVGDTVWLVTDARSLLGIPYGEVSRVELRIRSGSRVLRGAGIGLGIAAVLALGAYAVYRGSEDCEGEACWVPGAVAVFGAAGLGVLAILIGTGIGAATLAEHWEEVPLEALRVP